MKIKPTELTKLREYFDANGVSYETVNWEDNRYNLHEDNWYNLHVDLEHAKLSFLTSEGSYGGYNGLIEFYNFRDEPTGYLTAEDAIQIYEVEVKG